MSAEYFEKEGTWEELVKELMNTYELSWEDSESCLNFIKDNLGCLSEDELFQCNSSAESLPGVAALIINEAKYYVSVKNITIYMILWLLDEKLPVVLKILEKIFNVPDGKVLRKLNEQEGESCIMIELARNRKHGADSKLLKKFKGECCNNHLDCRFRREGMCSCTSKKVKRIYESFRKDGILKKKYGRYFYQI